MGDLFYVTCNYLLSGAIRQMLTGAGLALATAGVSVTFINSMIARVSATLSGLPELAISLLDLSGCDVALSLMLGAVVARVAINSAKVHLVAS